MGGEKSGEKQGRDWKALIAEKGRELSALGEGELEEAVRRELISRAASTIVEEMERSRSGSGMTKNGPRDIQKESEMGRTGEWRIFGS